MPRQRDFEASDQFGTGAVMRVRLAGMVVATMVALGWPVVLSAQSQSERQSVLPAGFVYLHDVDPTILQDIRYASTNNFTGKRLAGYAAAECVLRREAAAALARVQQDLKPRGLSLKVLDCYRPQRASRAMLAWANDGTEAQRRYYPRLNKRELFSLGYIAAYSGHSTGAVVDLTLVDLAADGSAAFAPEKTYADCTAPADRRAPEGSIDMGTGFDCFDTASHTASASITPQQRRWRQTLKAAMGQHGFVNYFREWWHFSLPGAGHGGFDFPIPLRER